MKLMGQREILIEYRPDALQSPTESESVQPLMQNLSKHQYSRLAPLSFLFPDLFLFLSKPDTVDSAYIERVKQLSIQADKMTVEIPSNITDSSWSTLNLIPALLRKHGQVRLSKRPIKWYLDVCRSFGCSVIEAADVIIIESPVRHISDANNIALDFQKPTFTGTSMALVFAAWYAIDYKSTTTIINASQEPEIHDMIDALRRLGYRIDEASDHRTCTLSVSPLETELNPVTCEVELDRNVLFTYLCGIVLAGKQCAIKVNQNASINEATPLFSALDYKITSDNRWIKLSPLLSSNYGRATKEMHFGFAPMPGSDWQPLFSTTASMLGVPVHIYDHVFEDRFKYLESVKNIAQNIAIERMADGSVVIDKITSTTVSRKPPISVRAGDLRYGAAIMLACLSVDRRVIITNIHQIFRGYANPVELFNSISNQGTFYYVQR